MECGNKWFAGEHHLSEYLEFILVETTNVELSGGARFLTYRNL